MYFAEFVMENKDKVFEIAQENIAHDGVVSTLYEEWEKSEENDEIINFYR